jgi:hypothetical protein
MRNVLIMLFSAGSLFAAEPSLDAKLAELKRAFPEHSSGPVNERSDPLIVECFTKYQKAVQGLAVATLTEGIGDLRSDLDAEIRRYERRNADTKS